MAVNIQIVGNNAAEAIAEIHALAASMSSTEKTAPSTTITARTRKPAEPKSEPAPQISTGEERVAPEDTPADQAKDAADETADSKKTDAVDHDTIRTALGAYVKKFGMPAAQEDGPKVIALALGNRDPKDDKVAWKISDIPAEPDKLKKVLEGVVEMTEKNPFKREVVKAK